MNTNEIRWYLHNLESIKEEIRQIQTDLDEYRKMDISIPAQVITDMPICHSSTSRTEDIAVTRADYVKSMQDELDHKMRVVRAINNVTMYLDDKVKEIIQLRYYYIPQGKHKLNWVEIGLKVAYSEAYCKEIDCKIIRQIQDKILQNNLHNTYTSCVSA